jgi:PiT family inorganic phosphate transporter
MPPAFAFVQWENFGIFPWASLSATVVTLIVLALVFDFLNGFNDATNSVAMVVSTRVLSPHMAVLWAAFFNFIAFLVFPLTVAATMGTGIIDPRIVNDRVIASTLAAACLWDVLAWYWAVPTSSSHALIGGLVGAGIMEAGMPSLQWDGIAWTLAFIVLAPVMGFLIGAAIAVAVAWIFHKATPRRVDRLFRRGQFVSAALYSLGHGGNDAQKTMGIIFLLLISASRTQGFAEPREVPTEVVLACHLAMALGTLFGGWRIVKTMGQRLSRLRPVDGFCAETGAATTLVLTIFLKVPVSTTHTITGSIVGAAATLQRWSSVRWGLAGRVVWAWILTIPGTAIVAIVCSWLLAFVK